MLFRSAARESSENRARWARYTDRVHRTRRCGDSNVVVSTADVLPMGKKDGTFEEFCDRAAGDKAWIPGGR